MPSRFAALMMLLVLFVCAALPLSAQAQAAYRWVDKAGHVHYSDTPPPPTEAQKVERKQINVNKVDEATGLTVAMRKAMQDFPLTLYTAPNCMENCKIARDFLGQRNIPYTEKSIQTRDDLDAFKKTTGIEEAIIPVLQAGGIGGKVEKGFEENAWRRLLDTSGYPPPRSGAAPAAPAPAPAPPRPSGRPLG